MGRFLAATVFALAMLLPAVARADFLPACNRLALTLVIDRSGSMTGQKLDEAKAAATAAVDHLTGNDCVSVITFDSAPQTVVPMQSASNATAIKNAIAHITAGGGTEILSALQAAHGTFTAQTAGARKKHVVLLTDGQSPVAGLQTLVQTMAAAHETLTTAGLGSDVDEQTLRSLSSTGTGRYYHVVDPKALARIFTREIDLALAP